MAKLGEKYKVSRGQYGLAVIEYIGLCTDDEATDLLADCTRQFELVGIPNAAGAILKAMDGTQPRVVDIAPTTTPGQKFRCVKIDAIVNPYTYLQSSGPWAGYYINSFLIVYQQVGDVA